MEFNKLYFGTIDAVYPPGHALNTNKYQYEYRVVISFDGMSQIPLKCIRNDPYGSPVNCEDAIMTTGDRVFVLCPKGERTYGIIMGGGRLYGEAQDASLAPYYRHRYNQIEEYIDKMGSWSIMSDEGPFIEVTKQSIQLDDNEGDSIFFDKLSKTITIECKNWEVVVKGEAKISVEGSCSVAVKGDLSAQVAGDAAVEVKGEANIQAKNIKAEAKTSVEVKAQTAKIKTTGKCNVESSADITVKGANINLNGQMGKVLTTLTDPITDPITGMPHIGVPNVKAGGA